MVELRPRLATGVLITDESHGRAVIGTIWHVRWADILVNLTTRKVNERQNGNFHTRPFELARYLGACWNDGLSLPCAGAVLWHSE